MVLTILFTSIIPYILFVYVMNVVEFQLVGTFIEIISIPDFFLLILLGIGIGSLIQGIFQMVNKFYFSTVVEFVRKEGKKLKAEMKDL